jgi:hypothetical protein
MNTCEKITYQMTEAPCGIRSLLRLCGPALLARYVLHQARICHQSVDDLARSLQRYRDALQASPSGEVAWFGIGDLWSGLLWWRDEATWVGRTGVLTRDDVQELVLDTLNEYVRRLEEGASHDQIANSISGECGAPAEALRLMSELTADGGTGEFRAPGFRALVSYVVCELGLGLDVVRDIESAA